MTVLGRFLVMMVLLFWQGGFLFYASVVVPVGQSRIGHLTQGSVTQQVTNYLNLSGAIALAVIARDKACPDPRRWRRIARMLLWLGMAIALACLVWLHADLDALLNTGELQIIEGPLFRALHRAYLWISTIQWMFGLAFLWLTLDAWRAADQMKSAPGSEAKKMEVGSDQK